MAKLVTQLLNYKQTIKQLSALKVALLYFTTCFLFAAYYSVVLPQQFHYSAQTLIGASTLKKVKLQTKVKKIMFEALINNTDNFFKRVEDGGAVYSYVYSEQNSSTEPVYAKVNLDTLSITNVSVVNGFLYFDLQRPLLSFAGKTATLPEALNCFIPVSSHRPTDSENDLIFCNAEVNEKPTALTQSAIFYVESLTPPEPVPIVFSELKAAMPMARNLYLNQQGLFGIELTQFEPMLLLSISIITTSGTHGIEPVTAHARRAIAIETLIGLLLIVWLLSKVPTLMQRKENKQL